MSRRKSIFLSSQEAQPSQKELDELSNEIDQNLRTIALIHPFSPAEKPLLVKGAFVKPNKLGFHHVVHYLVMIISAADFRKRFRWPILSVADESEFRTQAVNYFNDCHSQFKWNFGKFKMQLVLFPGGIEFMRVIIELSKIAMNAVLKQQDCLHLINGRCITLQEASARLQAAEESFEQLESIRSKFQSMGEPFKEKTQRLNGLLRQLLSRTAFTPNMIDSAFLSSWQMKQYEEINGKVLPKLDALEAISSKWESFQQFLAATKPHQLQFDKEKLNASGLLKKSQHFDPQIDYDKLLEWFKTSMPDLVNAIHFEPPWSVSRLMQESQILNGIIVRADEFLERIDTLLKDLEGCSVLRKSQPSKGIALSYLNEKLILTPTINHVAKRSARTVIWEAIPAMDSPATAQRIAVMAIEDELDPFIGDFTSMRSATTKLDPLAMLSNAMQRNGFMKSKTAFRSFAHSSPKRLNSNNNVPPTTICKDNQTSRIPLSPMRKALF